MLIGKNLCRVSGVSAQSLFPFLSRERLVVMPGQFQHVCQLQQGCPINPGLYWKDMSHAKSQSFLGRLLRSPFVPCQVRDSSRCVYVTPSAMVKLFHATVELFQLR